MLTMLWNKLLGLPPPDGIISLIHTLKRLYGLAYQIGNGLSKRDKLGMHAQVEEVLLNVLQYVIQASFSPKDRKLEPLKHVRILMEVVKHLVRTEYELHIIKENQYIQLEMIAIQASKETNNWIRSLESKQNSAT